MRNNIFYWKYDCPLTEEEKRLYFFKDKYELASANESAFSAMEDFLGCPPDKITPAGSDGNHFAYIVDSGKKSFFFRADDGMLDDDYMLAESAVMKIVSKAGIPVPEIYCTDITKEKYPLRFQIMEFVNEKCLNFHYKNNSLDIGSISRQTGKYLSMLHTLKFDGFGFFNTELIVEKKEMKGLDASYSDYFNKKLDEHLRYLQDNYLFEKKTIKEIEGIFLKFAPLLEIPEGRLLHRDLAYWNILGTENNIRAIIDWDDAVIGDPSDDLGVLNCFYDDDTMRLILEAYSVDFNIYDNFECRIWLHTLRNMLWKAGIRHYMGYFDKGDEFFLSKNPGGFSLKNYTVNKILKSIETLNKY